MKIKIKYYYLILIIFIFTILFLFLLLHYFPYYFLGIKLDKEKCERLSNKSYCQYDMKGNIISYEYGLDFLIISLKITTWDFNDDKYTDTCEIYIIPFLTRNKSFIYRYISNICNVKKLSHKYGKQIIINNNEINCDVGKYCFINVKEMRKYN